MEQNSSTAYTYIYIEPMAALVSRHNGADEQRVLAADRMMGAEVVADGYTHHLS